MRRTWLFCAVIALCPVLAFVAWRVSGAQGDKPSSDAPSAKAAKKLPITQVVLFNTGLGYFQREGEVEGDVRIDLSVPTSDVNDLLKSMIIDNKGSPVSVSYEGIEPIDTKLKSFAVDLASNPTLGQLLNQARGEKIELTVEGTGGGAATPLTGTIVGMEAHFENQSREVHHLNVLASDGVRRVPMDRIQRVRFLDPVLEEEFRRALSVLSAGRADQRRLVSIHLKGDGKRKVKVGYVAETPIWKATYRLVLDNKDKKPSLQGWAIVENTTEEDWKDVRVVLVSGRPISFEMDLAQQLFMPRPKVDPEVYASLRPPTLAPTHGEEEARGGQQQRMQLNMLGQGVPQPSGLGQVGGFGGNQAINPSAANLGFGGGFVGYLGGTARTDSRPPAFGPGGEFNRYQSPAGGAGRPRLTYQELLARRNEMLEKRKREAHRARDVGSTLADLGDGIDDVVTNADRIGEGFRYSVEPRVNLPRQRSGLLSVLDHPITLSRVSVYSPAIHPRFPLRAVKLKNSTGQHLMQGPVAVYDEGEYVGDCRLPDMQPDQERLLTFAMDLGVEVRPEVTGGGSETTGVEARDGILHVSSSEQRRTTYHLMNRSKQDRLVVIEHQASDWKLAKDSEKPAESTRQTHRFEWKIESGKVEKRSVTEGRSHTASAYVLQAADPMLEHAADSPKAGAEVKAALRKLLAARKKVAALDEEIKRAEEELRPLLQDQERLVASIPKLPEGSAAHKRVLTRYDEQEAKVEKLQNLLTEKKAARQKEQADYETSAKALTVR
jgi:hypothetical protein